MVNRTRNKNQRNSLKTQSYLAISLILTTAISGLSAKPAFTQTTTTSTSTTIRTLKVGNYFRPKSAGISPQEAVFHLRIGLV
jgi:hypothetical protein